MDSEFPGCAEDLRRRSARLTCPFPNIGDCRRDQLRPLRSLGDIPCDLLGRRALLLHRSSDPDGRVRNLADHTPHRPDVRDRLLRHCLDLSNLLTDFAGRLGGLTSQVLDLCRHHGKALPSLSGPGRFDRGVERQQVRLCGDVGDYRHDRADALGADGKLLDGEIRLIGLGDTLLGDLG